MRKITITNPKIIALLEEKKSKAEENQKILQQMNELEKDFNKKLAEISRVDEKARKIILKEVLDITFGEYEELSRTTKDGENWIFEIADRMEEFIASWKQNKEKK